MDKKEYNNRAMKRYRMKYPNKALWRSCYYSSKKRGLEFDITPDDIVIPTVCPILEIPLEYGGDSRANWPTVDRIDNTLGYIKSNIGVISYRANQMKSNMLLWQAENLLAYMKR